MTRILDGDLSTKVLNVSVPAEKFPLLKMRLNAISRRIQGMETKSCKLCSILQSSFIHHGHSGCPAIFNMCFTCLGRHRNGCCKSGALFKVKTGFCWKCWMPLNDVFGIGFHSKKKEELGRGCNNEALDFVKPACMHYFTIEHAPSLHANARKSPSTRIGSFHMQHLLPYLGPVKYITYCCFLKQ